MKVSYAKALVKDIEAVSRNPAAKKRLSKLIETFKAIDTLDELKHINKIKNLTVEDQIHAMCNNPKLSTMQQRTPLWVRPHRGCFRLETFKRK